MGAISGLAWLKFLSVSVSQEYSFRISGWVLIKMEKGHKMSKVDVESFIKMCITVLGESRVITWGEMVDVSGLKRDVVSVLYPVTIKEVQAIVGFANQYAVPLYPVSQGKNWGMGSQLPVKDGCAVVNLSKMNRVIEVNEQFGYAEIEAGVTQGQLSDLLSENNSSLFLDVTGSGRQTSIIGCAIDRGVAYNSLRAETLVNLKVVLGNGEILETGFGHFPKSVAKNVFKHGVGPDLVGLFTQGSFGIVVSAVVKLQYKPKSSCSFIISISSEDRLPGLIDALYQLRSRGIIQCVAHIANRNRTALTLSPLMFLFAKNLTEDATRELIDTMIEKEKLGAWGVVGSIMGTANHVREVRQQIKRAIADLGKVTFLSDSKIMISKKVLDVLLFLPFF